MDTMKDPEFLAEADKQKFEITPVPGAAIEKLVAEDPQDAARACRARRLAAEVTRRSVHQSFAV